MERGEIISGMSRPEQYVYYLGRVPSLKKTLTAMNCCLVCSEIFHKSQKWTEELVRACHEVRASVRLKFLFGKIMQLLTSINKKRLTESVEGGFGLTTLKNLGKVKANSGDTVEQYFIARMFQMVPEALDLVHDMPSISEARNVSLKQISADVVTLKEGHGATRGCLRVIAIRHTEGFDHESAWRPHEMSKELAESYAKSSEAVKDAETDFADHALTLARNPKIPPHSRFLVPCAISLRA